MSINIYKSQAKNMASINEKKELEAKKNKVLGDISQLDKKISDIKNFVNNKDIYATITNLNNIAREFSVKISLIKPAGIQDFPLYTRYPFELTVEAGNYHQIGKFVSKIESNPNVYTVESLEMRSTQGAEGSQPERIAAVLKIDTILFKNK
jgi:Tfp pilus assembly protein PilO